MLATFKGRRLRRWRLIAQIGAVVFLVGLAYGIPSFGSVPLLRYFFLPNASCRYINTAPTYCFFYSLQDGLTTGYAAFFIDVILILLIVTILILILGRLWCSWLCPFGLVQELLTDLRSALKIPPVRLKWSQKVILQQVKYAILFFTVLISVSIGISALGLTSYQSTLALPFYWRRHDASSTMTGVFNVFLNRGALKGNPFWTFNLFPLLGFGHPPAPSGAYWSVLGGLAGWRRQGRTKELKLFWIPFDLSD